jgi:hypothetical protein
MESFSLATIEYLPRLLVVVPLPEVVRTLTPSSGRVFDISYTAPLTVTWQKDVLV